jgi:1-acyl-sn-glycerol-3-phosphate acyltransferase
VVLAAAIRVRAARLVARVPQEAMAHYILGRWHLGMPRVLGGGARRAIGHFQAAHRLSPQDTRYAIGLAEALTAAGRQSEAEPLLQAVLAAEGRTDRDARRATRARGLQAAAA